VVIDYCHNVAGLESIGDFVGRMNADRAVGVISIPGDRSDEDMQQFGELAGRIFDRIIIREDDNRRGRAEGEIAERLRAAAVAGGFGQDNLEIVLDELEAVRRAVDTSERNELLVLLVDQPAKVWEMLTSQGAASA
jgi:cyanophycin synthetase